MASRGRDELAPRRERRVPSSHHSRWVEISRCESARAGISAASSRGPSVIGFSAKTMGGAASRGKAALRQRPVVGAGLEAVAGWCNGAIGMDAAGIGNGGVGEGAAPLAVAGSGVAPPRSARAWRLDSARSWPNAKCSRPPRRPPCGWESQPRRRLLERTAHSSWHADAAFQRPAPYVRLS
jgi:hypothetical protein